MPYDVIAVCESELAPPSMSFPGGSWLLGRRPKLSAQTFPGDVRQASDVRRAAVRGLSYARNWTARRHIGDWNLSQADAETVAGI